MSKKGQAKIRIQVPVGKGGLSDEEKNQILEQLRGTKIRELAASKLAAGVNTVDTEHETETEVESETEGVEYV